MIVENYNAEFNNKNYVHFSNYNSEEKIVYDFTYEEWNDKKINMELDHIDGNRTNHKLKNLRMLCPNCHSQTDTYRAKNIK